MTCAELIVELKQYPPEAEVIAPYPVRPEDIAQGCGEVEYAPFMLGEARNGKDISAYFEAGVWPATE
jgi:hypothetical protein